MFALLAGVRTVHDVSRDDAMNTTASAAAKNPRRLPMPLRSLCVLCSLGEDPAAPGRVEWVMR